MTRSREMNLQSATRRTMLLAAAAASGGALASGVYGSARAAADATSSTVDAGGEALRSLRTDLSIVAEGRTVRVSQWKAWGRRRGVILFSHGASSAPEKYERLIGPWNAAGFEVMGPLHVDSTDYADSAKYPGLASWAARLQDMRALSAMVDGPYVAAGHSYGALVALTLGGAAADLPATIKGPVRDPQVQCVVAFSPPGPVPSLISAAGYAALASPALVETGDRDVPVVGTPAGPWQVHLSAYDAAPPGDKYSLILEGVDHYFGGLICKATAPGPPQDAQLTAAAAMSTLFMDAYAVKEPMGMRLLEAALAQTGPVKLSRK